MQAANDVATALTSPFAYTQHIPGYQFAGSASGSELANTLTLVRGKDGQWELHGDCLGGYGASVSVSGPKLARGTNYVPVKPDQSTTAPLTIAEQVTTIRSALGLNVSELAQVLQVTRPTVYGWLKGIEPHPTAVTRVAKLLTVANAVGERKFARIDLLVRRPVGEAPFAGVSLLSLLASETGVTDDHIDLLYLLDQREAAARAELKGLAPLRTHQEAIEDAVAHRGT